jgi:hypothetical protein
MKFFFNIFIAKLILEHSSKNNALLNSFILFVCLSVIPMSTINY